MKYLQLILLITLSSLLVKAQSNSSYINQNGVSNFVEIQQTGIGNLSSVKQLGKSNSNEIIQNGMGNYAVYSDLSHYINAEKFSSQIFNEEYLLASYNDNYNSSRIKQAGIMNGTTIFNSGENNDINVSQDGITNTYICNNYGNNNYYEISQLGGRNIIAEDIRVSSHEFIITQEGNFNRIIHTDNSSSGFDLNITQQGNWMMLIIKNGVIR